MTIKTGSYVLQVKFVFVYHVFLLTELEAIAEHTVLSASFLATEVGLILIDRACLFMKNLGAADGVAAKPYLKLLQYPQSETLYKHLFAALRAYINQFSETLFEGKSLYILRNIL